MILIVGPDEGTTTPPGGGIVYTPGVIKWAWPVTDLGDGVIRLEGNFNVEIVQHPGLQYIGGFGLMSITEV